MDSTSSRDTNATVNATVNTTVNAALSTSAQDYVKAIWKISEWYKGASEVGSMQNSDSISTSLGSHTDGHSVSRSGSHTGSHAAAAPSFTMHAVSSTDLARETGVSASTVSGALNRLATQGLVEHAPYGGILLTAEGRKQAIAMIRRHRLIETFLVRELGYTWSEVHNEAESLEHAASDMMINRIEEKLCFPDRDPHGDPIPDRMGMLPVFSTINLNLVPVGAQAIVARVNDDNVDLLHTLETHRAMVDSRITVVSADAEKLTLVRNSFTTDEGQPESEDSQPFFITRVDADFIRVTPIKG